MFLFQERYLHIISTLAGLKNRIKSRRIANSDIKKKEVKRICIYKLDHLGDVLYATAAFKAIRLYFPNAEIRLVAGEWADSIVKNNPDIDLIFHYNSKHFIRSPYLAHEFKIVKKMLNEWKPELIFSLRGDWATELNSLFSSAAICERGSVHLKEKIRRLGDKRCDTEYVRLENTIKKIGITNFDMTKHYLYLSEEELKEAKQNIDKEGITKPFVVMHAGASVKLREWKVERFSEVAEYIYNNSDLTIVLIGSKAETKQSQEIANILSTKNVPYLDITGKYDIRATSSIIGMAELYLGNDGGMMHIASSLGVRTIGLYGPGSTDVFGLFRKNNIIINKHLPCSPCTQSKCIRPEDNCMDAISVDEVISSVEKLIQIKI